MRKKKDRTKDATKTRVRRARGSMGGKQIYQNEPDPWKELRLKLQPLNKAYRNFKEKRRIAKEKEERKRLQEQEEQRVREEEAQRLMEQEEKKVRKDESYFFLRSKKNQKIF